MTASFVALYPRPDDADGFEAHFAAVHLPIVQRYPGVRSVSVTRLTGTPRGGPPDYHLLLVAEFASDEEMGAALRSDAGVESARDARAMKQRFGVAPVLLLGRDL